MINSGYFRTPTILGNDVLFVCEDDLWTVSADGGIARRITNGLGPVGRGHLSSDGQTIAFTGSEEHHPEVYVMAAAGGSAKRITYLGGNSAVKGFLSDGRIAFATNHGSVMRGSPTVMSIKVDGSDLTPSGFGLANDWSVGESGGVLVGRFTSDPARWKRYRGGMRGAIWIDRKGDGNFKRLLKGLEGNIASPMWIGSRVFFISDHEGTGNIYSCKQDGKDIRRHTDHDGMYARFATTDGTRIVYQNAATIWILDPSTGENRQIEIDFRSDQQARNRKFVETKKFWDGVALHPSGHTVALQVRGRIFEMGLWEKAPKQIGRADGVRYERTAYSHDGSAIYTMSDEGGTQAFEIWEEGKLKHRFDDFDLGYVLDLQPSPSGDLVALSNQRGELILINISKASATTVDTAPDDIESFRWSSDGRYLVYVSLSQQSSEVRVFDSKISKIHRLTSGEFLDHSPVFDPSGRYLYFLSNRDFNPIYDEAYFDLGFHGTTVILAFVLDPSAPSPFAREPKGFGDSTDSTDKPKKPAKEKPFEINFDGLADRVVAFPIAPGTYSLLSATKDKVFWTSHPESGSYPTSPFAGEGTKPTLMSFDLAGGKAETVSGDTRWYTISQDTSTILCGVGDRPRAFSSKEKPSKDDESMTRAGGFVDLTRIRCSVDPALEYKQMFFDTWRAQNHYFWTADMSGVDWVAVRDRYAPLVAKISTRLEWSDFAWDFLGELGTSHAYEVGGDYLPPPAYVMGHLGAEYEPTASGRWRITSIARGDDHDPGACSPLRAPGVDVRVGDEIEAVNGVATTVSLSPRQLFVNHSGTDVNLRVRRSRKTFEVSVKTLTNETRLRYRDWVNNNRRTVLEASNGKLGYVHIPDMGAAGYSEFHRSYAREVLRGGLIVDVRYNGGGHVSQLILEKLGRKVIGWEAGRWSPLETYPWHAPNGPLVCVTDELAGSDGDIFTHGFKLMGLGPVVGKRTWGGVIGIAGRHRLVDGGATTQPEFSNWFNDVGWGLENYGADPDFDVDIAPQDYLAGRDPQLDKAISLALKALAKFRSTKPDMKNRRLLKPPPLPPRA